MDIFGGKDELKSIVQEPQEICFGSKEINDNSENQVAASHDGIECC